MDSTPPIAIEVFKTKVPNLRTANRIIRQLTGLYPGSRINFDLEDRDKILRLEGVDFSPEQIKSTLNHHGYFCDELEQGED